MNKKRTSLSTWLDNFDMFGASVKSFNFEGRHNMHTSCGVLCSFILYLFVGMYALNRSYFVVVGKVPEL